MRHTLFAPAKVNLDLRITGTHDDGYHTLHSHVAFADCGDEIILDIEEAPEFSCTLKINGPFAPQLETVLHEQNLAYKAAQKFSAIFKVSFKAHIQLTKNIPSGAGLGGGSADAAAILRGLARHFDIDIASTGFQAMALSVGADVPVCLYAKPCLMQGIGEIISPWQFPATHAVLIWPGYGASTQALYAAYDAQPEKQSALTNDFLPVAVQFCPDIHNALAWLRAQKECYKTGLTGSGTAVFGLFPSQPEIHTRPEFPWVQVCKIGS